MTITREEWASSRLVCMACGRVSRCGGEYDEEIGPWELQTHEIPRGVHRERALKEPAAWLRVCQGLNGGCHELMSGMPVVVQLALKKRADLEHYCRETVNALRRRSAGAITESEVDRVVGWLEAGLTLDHCKELLR